MMFKRKGGRGGQRLFEQCSKKLHFSYGMASLTSQAATLLLDMVGEVLGQDLDHGLSGVCVKYLDLLLS